MTPRTEWLGVDAVIALQDVFLLRATYGDSRDLVKTISGWGIDQAEFAETRNEPFIPGALKLPFSRPDGHPLR